MNHDVKISLHSNQDADSAQKPVYFSSIMKLGAGTGASAGAGASADAGVSKAGAGVSVGAGVSKTGAGAGVST